MANANRRTAHRHPGRPGQGRDGGRASAARPATPGRPASSAAAAAHSTWTTSTSAVRRPRARSSSCRRHRGRPRRRRHQDAAGDHQQPATGGPSPTTSSPRSTTRATSRWPGWSAGTRRVCVLAGDLIARITAQTCRQSGLSVVYTELLDFDGDEIYFHEEPALVGQHLRRDAAARYEDSCVDRPACPHGDADAQPADGHRVAGRGDRLIMLSEDDDTITPARVRRRRPIERAHRRGRPGAPPEPERDADPGLEPSQPRSCCASSTATSRRARTITVVADHSRRRR